MTPYAALPNGAQADLSSSSFIRLAADGAGTLRVCDGRQSHDFSIHVEDTLNLGTCVHIALSGGRASFIRRDGKLLVARAYPPAEQRTDIEVGNGNDWGV